MTAITRWRVPGVRTITFALSAAMISVQASVCGLALRSSILSQSSCTSFSSILGSFSLEAFSAISRQLRGSEEVYAGALLFSSSGIKYSSITFAKHERGDKFRLRNISPPKCKFQDMA
jgi:hypothetical protein